MPRLPTVSPHNPRSTKTLGPAFRSPFVGWLKRESVALLALSGAALTVLAQISALMPLAPALAHVLAGWQELTRGVWRPPFDLVGVALHPDLVAALTVSAFMALLGGGARLSARLGGEPLEPMTAGRFFDDQTWPSLIVFAALSLVFLMGTGSADSSDVLRVMGSEEVGKLAFAGIVTTGYFAGDFIGHRPFHLRLYRLAAIVAVLVVANLALVHLA